MVLNFKETMEAYVEWEHERMERLKEKVSKVR